MICEMMFRILVHARERMRINLLYEGTRYWPLKP